jgi:hypothetical protein
MDARDRRVRQATKASHDRLLLADKAQQRVRDIPVRVA